MAYNPGQRKRPKMSELIRPELSAQDRYRKHFRIGYLLRMAKRRTKERGWEFTIQEHELNVPTHCPLLGIEFDNYSEDIDNYMSLDRIDSKKGYVSGNVMVVSYRANRIKNNATADELMLLATNLKHIEESL